MQKPLTTAVFAVAASMLTASLAEPPVIATAAAGATMPRQAVPSIGAVYPAGVRATSANSPTVTAELPSLRAAHSNTFDLGDGRYRTLSYPDPVNYRDASGAWRPIDNTLVAGAGGWTNRAGPYSVTLPALLSAPVGVSASGFQTSFTLNGAAPAAGKASGSTVTYPDALPATTVIYAATSSGVKESLLLSSAAAPTTFSYTLGLGAGLSAATTADGRVLVTVNGRTTVFVLPAPTVVDAAGAGTAGAFSLTGSGTTLTLTLAVDPAWLRSSSRAFPVTVDPTATLGVSGPGDCELYSGSPTTSYCTTTTYLDIGQFSSGALARDVLHFDLSSIPDDATVLNADLQLTAGTTPALPTPLTVEAHNLAAAYTSSASWSSSGTASWTGGSFNPAVADSATLSGTVTAGQTINLYPTALVQNWVSGAATNNGILLKVSNETLHEYVRTNASEAASGGPQLVVTWSPVVGEQPYYSYTEHRLNDRSHLHINNGSGDLLAHASDIHVNATGLAVNVDRFYNSCGSTTVSSALAGGSRSARTCGSIATPTAPSATRLPRVRRTCSPRTARAAGEGPA